MTGAGPIGKDGDTSEVTVTELTRNVNGDFQGYTVKLSGLSFQTVVVVCQLIAGCSSAIQTAPSLLDGLTSLKRSPAVDLVNWGASSSVILLMLREAGIAILRWRRDLSGYARAFRNENAPWEWNDDPRQW